LRLIDDAPSHLFLSYEQNDLVTLVQLALIFGWGLAACAGDGTAAFAFNHDRVMFVYGDPPDRVARLTKSLPQHRLDTQRPTT
jgi:hypothetical protein